MSPTVSELVSPSTDRAVAVQVVVTVMIIVLAAWIVRRERSLVLLVVGIGTVVLALFGFRALH